MLFFFLFCFTCIVCFDLSHKTTQACVSSASLIKPPGSHAMSTLSIAVTEAQRKIIAFPMDTGRALEVVSGPGAGKSTTLVYKLAFLIGEGLVDPRKVLVLSMTNRAVDSVKKKLGDVLGEERGNEVNIHTFHALSHMMMSENDVWFQDVDVLDEPGWSVLSELAKLNKYRLRECITKVRGLGGSDDAISAVAAEYRINEKNLKDVLEMMERLHTIIHADFLRGAKHLLRDGKTTVDYDIVVVDEFQDMYPDLWEFVELVSEKSHLIVAGDPCQSIYSFLGSNTQVEQQLHKFKPVDTITMSESFRSTPQIMSASERILHMTRNLSSSRPSSVKPILTSFASMDDQSQYIADEILRLTFSSNNEIQYRDIAVLARTNADLERLAKTLSFYHIPHLKLSSTPAWLDNELSNMMNYLNVLYRPDKAHWSVVCTLKLLPGVGPAMVTRLEKLATESGACLYTYILDNRSSMKPSIQGYVDMMEQTREVMDFHDEKSIMSSLLQVANELGLRKLVAKNVKNEMDKNHITRQLLDFYENLKMFGALKPDDVSVAEYFLQNYMDRLPSSQRKDAVKISTIHSSKGLEFPIVFLLTGDKLLSSRFEDRKLQYVGMTRAQSLLYVNVLNNDMDEDTLKQELGPHFRFEAPEIDSQLVSVIKDKALFRGDRFGIRGVHTWARVRPSPLISGIMKAGLTIGRRLIR